MAKKSWSCIQQQVCSSIYSLSNYSTDTEPVFRHAGTRLHLVSTNLHLTKARDCQGPAERLEQGASLLRWAQALTVPARTLTVEAQHLLMEVWGIVLQQRLRASSCAACPMDGSWLPPPLAPGQGRFLLAMKKHVFCCQCVIIWWQFF